MLPLIIMAAAQLLSDRQKKQQEQTDLMQSTLDRSAQRMGGGDLLNSDVYGAQRKINDQSTNYGPLLSLVGSAVGDEEDKPRGVTPRSGVKLKLSDFY